MVPFFKFVKVPAEAHHFYGLYWPLVRDVWLLGAPGSSWLGISTDNHGGSELAQSSTCVPMTAYTVVMKLLFMEIPFIRAKRHVKEKQWYSTCVAITLPVCPSLPCSPDI